LEGGTSGLFFGMSKLLSKPISINLLGTKKSRAGHYSGLQAARLHHQRLECEGARFG
jgi:hypothetical protein